MNLAAQVGIGYERPPTPISVSFFFSERLTPINTAGEINFVNWRKKRNRWDFLLAIAAGLWEIQFLDLFIILL